jgi:hypothetical protein
MCNNSFTHAQSHQCENFGCQDVSKHARFSCWRLVYVLLLWFCLMSWFAEPSNVCKGRAHDVNPTHRTKGIRDSKYHLCVWDIYQRPEIAEAGRHLIRFFCHSVWVEFVVRSQSDPWFWFSIDSFLLSTYSCAIDTSCLCNLDAGRWNSTEYSWLLWDQILRRVSLLFVIMNHDIGLY